MSSIADKAQDTFESGKESIKSAARGNGFAKDKWQNTVDGARDTYETAKETARDTYESAKNSALDATKVANTKAKEFSEYLSNTISNNPLKSVAVVALGAWVLGKLTR